jgi:prevent-host-death family protein
VTEARAQLAELVNRVVFGGERIVLTRHKKPVAAIVSAEDYELLESLRRERIDLTGIGRPGADPSGDPVVEPLRIAAEYRPPGPPPPPGAGRRPGFRS